MENVTIARFVALLALTLTIFLFTFSSYFAHVQDQWIPRVAFHILFALLVPIQSLTIKEKWRQSIWLKGIGDFLCYYGFNFLGRKLPFADDSLLVHASIIFFIYLLAIEWIFNFEDVLGLCNAYLFAGCGLMLDQNKISHKVIFFICFLLCFLKNFSNSMKEMLASRIIRRRKIVHSPSVAIIYARLYGITMICVSCICFGLSTFLAKLQDDHQWISRVVFMVCMVLLFPFSSRLQIQERLTFPEHQVCAAMIYDIVRSCGSLGSFYVFGVLGGKLMIHNDGLLIHSSVFFYGYLLAIDYIYNLEDVLAILDGYVFAGYGLCLSQDVINHVVVGLTGLTFCFLKNYVRALRKTLEYREATT